MAWARVMATKVIDDFINIHQVIFYIYKNHTIKSPGTGDETKGMLEIELHHILTAPNSRDYDNPTFLKKEKIVHELIFMERVQQQERTERITNLPLELFDGTNLHVLGNILKCLPQL